MKVIPIQATPSQTVSVVLDGQSCRINLYQKLSLLFVDVFRDGVLVISGRICRDRTKLIRHEYRGFFGDLFFMDTQGANDPEYPWLGTRYLLMFVDQATLDSEPQSGSSRYLFTVQEEIPT